MEAYMAYCDKCGAYIPDGQKVCLACGYDEEAEKARAAQAAQAEEKRSSTKDTGKYYSFSNEEMRRKLDEQRKKQQEQSRKWAEQEKQRREKERENEGWQSYSDSAGAETVSGTDTPAGVSASNTKLFSILSYFSALFLIPMVFRPEDRTANYHAKQGMRLFIYGLICDAITWAPVVGALVQLSRLYLLIKGISNAANGREEPLPYIGTIGEKKN